MATIYRTVSAEPVKGAHPVRYSGSMGAAKRARKELAAEHPEANLRPLRDFDIETLEIPTRKALLIEWLNENCPALVDLGSFAAATEEE